MKRFLLSLSAVALLAGCSAKASGSASDSETGTDHTTPRVAFSADSAYSYIERQLAFGPRVPNTDGHRAASAWIASELRRHGAEVELQEATLKAFDGTRLQAVNIIGRYNPEATDRLLLLAHWDTRPWADEDPDPAKRKSPVPGANDGASGVGVLLEIARLLQANKPDRGIDILLVDAEDYGAHDDDDSWALGTRYYAEHLTDADRPTEAVLLDMVGGHGAVFCREYFSQRYAPSLLDRVWTAAARAGFSERFPDKLGGAINDDHVPLIQAGIPAIDIIEYNPTSGSGFNPTWHTTADDLPAIDRQTLHAVGQTLTDFIFPPEPE